MSEQAKDIAVLLRRDQTGVIYSEVVDRNVKTYSGEQAGGVVVDRQKGRGMDGKTIKMRAESLAALIGAPIDEDLTWPCIANRRLACRCPVCIMAGRV